MPMYLLRILLFIFIFSAGQFSLFAGDRFDEQEALKIFVDCDECDLSFIKINIPYVNYTIDPQSAEVLVKITHQNTGSGGRRYHINFLGQMNFTGFDQTLQYISSQVDSRDMDRKGITRTIEMGLMPYISQTSRASSVKIEVDQGDNTFVQPGDDDWNSWTYHIDFMGNYEAEESQNELSLTSSLRANHTSEELKIRSRIKYDYEREKIDDDGETVKSILRELESDFNLVKSLDEKWSLGFNAGVNSTTFRNIDLEIAFAPAVEYNFYPWSNSAQRIVALAYYAGIRNFDYIEKTIFDKTHETVYYEGLSLQLEVIEPLWEIEAYLSASHYFHDFNKNNIELYTNLSLKIVKGFSTELSLELERPRNQIYLPHEGATREEILLKRKKLATDYELAFSFGIQYSFGSIYNNVVNRRL
jgi:hypothetical protein